MENLYISVAIWQLKDSGTKPKLFSPREKRKRLHIKHSRVFWHGPFTCCQFKNLPLIIKEMSKKRPVSSNSATKEALNLPIRYWGSKYDPFLQQLIHTYTKKGDVVLEPFGGKGNFTYLAISMGRRAIYNDLNPYAHFIAQTLALPLDTNRIRQAFNQLMRNLERLKVLYTTHCKCGATQTIKYVIWSTRFAKMRYPHSRLPRIWNSQAPSRMKIVAEKLFHLINLLIKKKKFTYHELMQAVRRTKSLRKIRSALINVAINQVLVKKGLLKEIDPLPLFIVYNNKCICGRKGKKPEKEDLQKMPKTLSGLGLLRYDNGKYFLKRRKVDSLEELFTSRNLFVLSCIRQEIHCLQFEQEIKNFLLLCLSGILFASSKMQRLRSGSWAVACYWIPPVFVENNVILKLKRKVEEVIKWKEKNSFIPPPAKAQDVIKGEAGVAFLCEDARDLPLPDSCVDYIFVDPPQTDEIQYFELSYLPATWLGFTLPFESEIIVNEKQGKDEETYWKMISEALKESTRLLKPHRHMTILLHGEDESYYERVLNILKRLPLKVVSIQFVNYRFKNGLHAKDIKRLNGDFYLTLKRL